MFPLFYPLFQSFAVVFTSIQLHPTSSHIIQLNSISFNFIRPHFTSFLCSDLHSFNIIQLCSSVLNIIRIQLPPFHHFIQLDVTSFTFPFAFHRIALHLSRSSPDFTLLPHFTSRDFTSLHITSNLHVASLHCTSLCFYELRCTSLQIIALHFTSCCFFSLRSTSSCLIPLHSKSPHFVRLLLLDFFCFFPSFSSSAASASSVSSTSPTHFSTFFFILSRHFSPSSILIQSFCSAFVFYGFNFRFFYFTHSTAHIALFLFCDTRSPSNFPDHSCDFINSTASLLFLESTTFVPPDTAQPHTRRYTSVVFPWDICDACSGCGFGARRRLCDPSCLVVPTAVRHRDSLHARQGMSHRDPSTSFPSLRTCTTITDAFATSGRLLGL